MKRYIAIVISIGVFVLAVAGGAALMVFSPRGVLNPNSPGNALQTVLDSDTYDWAAEFQALYAPEITEFEDAAVIKEHLAEKLIGSSELTFREYDGASTGSEPVYILTGDRDFLAVTMCYADKQWVVKELTVPEELFQPETKTVTILAPFDAQVYVNGIEVSDSYIVQDRILYEDMIDLERSFSEIPYRVMYEIPGLYEDVTVTATRADGVLPESADGYNWVYTVPDAAAYSFSVMAPVDAVVSANETQLDPSESSGKVRYVPMVDVPAELVDKLPEYALYEADGLYTFPALTAVDADGVSIEANTSTDGTIVFPISGSAALQEEHHSRVTSFIENVAEYGAGHTARANPNAFTVYDTDLSRYFSNAISSLIWVVNVTVSYDDLTTYDYIPLGEDAFLCRANLICTTKTPYQTVDLDLEYEMLWTRVNGEWKVADMAFTDYYNREKVS